MSRFFLQPWCKNVACVLDAGRVTRNQSYSVFVPFGSRAKMPGGVYVLTFHLL